MTSNGGPPVSMKWKKYFVMSLSVCVDVETFCECVIEVFAGIFSCLRDRHSNVLHMYAALELQAVSFKHKLPWRVSCTPHCQIGILVSLTFSIAATAVLSDLWSKEWTTLLLSFQVRLLLFLPSAFTCSQCSLHSYILLCVLIYR